MAATSHDRNLLFGILAVQMDFISRDALVAAMNAWVLAKDKPLGEILVSQQALKPDRRALLDALVQEHLKQHGNDAEKSLAAISSVGSVRDDLRQIKDPEVQASIVHLAAQPPTDMYATRAHSVGNSTSSGSRFRILRPHARGGLGTVSVARDEELPREVALKEIQEQHADNPDSRCRFLLEAEITGGLEHPGIVPVYGLGQYADGRPYYAMRFIRGDSLEEAVERFHRNPDKRLESGERAMELRALLGRFIDVCNAIAYAHSRGVLHRDLKPGNIMLGQYGETLVVDWGLAKTQDPSELKTASAEGPIRPSSVSSSAATQMGSTLGTPKYMSPEQAAGRLDLLGPASDVYSLGATLYCLLTGRAPMEGLNVEMILQNVQRGEFAPPRAVNPHIARPLEAICLKAMALKPEDRYPSCKALADDVEHWLADEPVSAYSEAWAAKVARWARKHKTLVVSSFGLTAAAAVALAVITVVVKREQLLTEQARLEAVDARDTAQRRFRLALDALNDMVQGIQTKLEVRPGTQDLRKDLLENARRRVQELLQEAERQGNPDQTLVWSYFRMGDVDQVIGDTQAAKKEYASALALASTLAAADPRDSSAQSDLGISYINLGNIAQQLGQTQEAVDFYQKALLIRQHRAEIDPKDAKAQRGLSVNYERLGDVTMQLGHTQEALDFYRKASSIRQVLADADATNVQTQYDLSVNEEKLGDATMQLGRTQEALDFFQKEQTIRERLARRDPKNTQAQRSLSVSYERLGDVMQRLSRTAEARDFYGKAASICASLAEADPKNAQAQRDLGVAYTCLGDLAKRSGQVADSLDFYRKVLAINTRLADADPKNLQGQNDLSVSYERLGDATSQSGRTKEAQDFYQKAREIREQLAKADAKSALAQRNLTVSYNKLGALLLRLGQKPEALEYYHKALAIRLRLAEADSKNAQAQRDLAFSYEKLGDVTLQLDQIKQSLDFYEKARAIYERLAEADPANVPAQRDLLAVCYGSACRYARLSTSGEKEAREQDARRATELLRQAVAKGYKDIQRLQSDKDLDSLREREDFKQLIGDLKKAVPAAK
jgi:serine/threonine-protein kinase